MAKKKNFDDELAKWMKVIDNIKLDEPPIHNPRILTNKEIKEIKEKCNPRYDITILDLVCTVEHLQRRNEQLDKLQKLQDEYIEELKTQNSLLKEILEQTKELLTTWLCARTPEGKQAKKEALAEIDKALGGKEDV